MPIDVDDLFEIVKSVWATVVEVELERVDPSETDHTDSEEFLCAWMELSGSWSGGLLLSCSHSLAVKAASIMYEVEESMLGEEAVHDTIGELANMVAGSTKPLLPDDTTLDQPDVLEESDLPEKCLSGWPQVYIATKIEDDLLYVSFFKWEDD